MRELSDKDAGVLAARLARAVLQTTGFNDGIGPELDPELCPPIYRAINTWEATALGTSLGNGTADGKEALLDVLAVLDEPYFMLSPREGGRWSTDNYGGNVTPVRLIKDSVVVAFLEEYAEAKVDAAYLVAAANAFRAAPKGDDDGI